MLVLTRNQGEEVVIGENIRVTVLAIRGNQVRLGFTAPPDVRVHRKELRPVAEEGGTPTVRPAVSAEGP
jgi:carbon storage regulator